MKQHTANKSGSFPHALQQRGAASLIVSLIILALITFVTIYTSKSIILEQKIANNDYRSKQAMEAAEAGIGLAINYYSEDPDADSDGVLDGLVDSDGDGAGDWNFDADGDGTNESHSYVVGASNRVIVTATDLSPDNNMTILRLTSQGFSDDDTATRTIVQDISTVNPLPNSPSNPFTTRGTVVVTGSATIHNPEGHSTIWSGGDVDLGANNSTATEVADVTDADYPGCMDNSMDCNVIQSSNKVTVGLDVIEHDSNLANLADSDFFENFFGMSPTNFRASMVTKDTTAANANTDVQLATNEIIWVEGDTTFSNNTTVGCKAVVTGGNVCSDANTKPSIMIINGNATFGGTTQFYGIVYVTGSITISGNSTVYGALVGASSVTNNTGGSLDIWYNSDVLDRTKRNGPLGSSAGSWRDFI
jgi:hypothetical protein